MAVAEECSSNGASRWSLKGMTALITGGTRGIGHAIVEDLCGFGATVHTCSRNQVELDNCLDQWRRKGFLVSGSVCDVSSREQREKLIQEVASIFNGKLHIYVNNVGANFRKPTIEYTAEVYSEIMAINLDSAYHLCQLTHPLLKASGMGSIVFISSIAGVVSLGTGSVYAASKAAINQLTKNLACEWAKDGIRSNCVVPATTNTPLVEHHILSSRLCSTSVFEEITSNRCTKSYYHPPSLFIVCVVFYISESSFTHDSVYTASGYDIMLTSNIIVISRNNLT